MKPTFLAFLLVSLIGMPVTAFTETFTNVGPEVIRFKMGDLTLPFKHWVHQKKVQGRNCFLCHADGAGKIKDWGEGTAHALCISCHERLNKGPVECKFCHSGIIGRK